MPDHAANARSITDSGRTVRQGEGRTVRPELSPWRLALADTVDWVIVDRLVHGVPVDRPTSWERREAVRQLRRVGCSYSQIAARLGIHQRQVLRHLRQVGLVRFPAEVHGGTASPFRSGASAAPDDPKDPHATGGLASAGTA
jgi:DNA-binding transcriptional ArsR family regulator